MVRRAPGVSDVRVYDVSTRTAVPLDAHLNVGLKSDAALQRARRKASLNSTHTDLIQDFAFPTVSQRIKLSRDGRYIFASGTYPPQLHVYDTTQLSLKFKRHVDNEIVDFQILDDDWRKFVILSADRYLDFHSQFGSHYKTRVPLCGRDLMIHRGTADLFVCGQGPSVWRFNLDQGRFLAPLQTACGADAGINVCGVSPATSLLAFGSDTGLLDIYDPRLIGRNQRPVATLDVVTALQAADDRFALGTSAHASSARPEITALRFDAHDGVSLAVGTTTGHSLLYDLRSAAPTLTRDQGNGLPIRSLRFHDDRTHVLSADARSVKIWERRSESGGSVTAIEPDVDINHVCVVGSSGVLCAAVEAPRVKSFYVPALGTAPKWCAFLDTFTEELEGGRDARVAETATLGDDGGDGGQVYENYKFVTPEELVTLGLEDMIGTDVLKAYMHGYFMHIKLYRRAVDVAQPFAYEKYRKQKARDKVEALRESRITKVRAAAKKAKKAKVKVNQTVVDTLKERKRSGKRGAESQLGVLEDARFKDMFSNEDFKVEEDADRYQFLNPSGNIAERRAKKREEEEESDEEYLERFDLVDEGDDGDDGKAEDNLWSSDEGEEEEDEDEGGNGSSGGEEAEEDLITSKGRQEKDGGKSSKGKGKGKGKMPKMFEIGKTSEVIGQMGLSANGRGDGVDDAASRRAVREKISLGERVTSSDPQPQGSGDKGRAAGRRRKNR